jgi:hypothetical protein
MKLDPPAWSLRAQRAETAADLLDEQGRLLERGEVPAAERLVPVADVGEPALRPAPRRPLKLFREHRTADRDGHCVSNLAGDPLPMQVVTLVPQSLPTAAKRG